MVTWRIVILGLEAGLIGASMSDNAATTALTMEPGRIGVAPSEGF
jgi:hypothetical protein